MGKKRDKLAEVQFACAECGHSWEGPPDRTEEVPDKSHHPWDYFAECPECGDDAGQDPNQASLLKAWANATGPRTPEGKAKCAANLEGYPTPEQMRLARFNSMKHGLRAEVATFFPAKPGRYPDCDQCPYLDSCRRGTACQRRTELFMRHHVAFEAKDPALLQPLRARTHALVSAILEMIQLDILRRGVALESPAWYYDKDGGFHLAEYVHEGEAGRFVDKDDLSDGERVLIMEVKAHPLLKYMTDIIKHTGMTLEDSGMTVKTQDDAELIEGQLAGENADRETLLEYQRRQTEAMDKLGALLDRAKDQAGRDPVLMEHEASAD